MKKKSFLAILCSAALFLQLAPAVLPNDVLSDATTDEFGLMPYMSEDGSKNIYIL